MQIMCDTSREHGLVGQTSASGSISLIVDWARGQADPYNPNSRNQNQRKNAE
ncbi:MAG: hypothetical protein RLZZ247_142 [Cyanobacteriota bacterium]|jgi:hypothetical protein